MKYNRSEIMKDAWSLYRMFAMDLPQHRLTFSECLRRAWRSAKRDAMLEEMVDDAVIRTSEGMLFCRRGVVADYTIGWNITGKTYACRKELRKRGFKWDPDSRCWYTTDRNVAKNFIDVMH